VQGLAQIFEQPLFLPDVEYLDHQRLSLSAALRVLWPEAPLLGSVISEDGGELLSYPGVRGKQMAHAGMLKANMPVSKRARTVTNLLRHHG
jgi:hypothetical protein